MASKGKIQKEEIAAGQTYPPVSKVQMEVGEALESMRKEGSLLTSCKWHLESEGLVEGVSWALKEWVRFETQRQAWRQSPSPSRAVGWA